MFFSSHVSCLTKRDEILLCSQVQVMSLAGGASREKVMNAGKQKTAALYARVSTADQNCALQLDDLRRFSSQRFGRYFGYVDHGISGAQRRRPQLDALMSDARKRRFDVSCDMSSVLPS